MCRALPERKLADVGDERLGPVGVCRLRLLPGHPAELSDSVKLLLTVAKSHVFEIDLVLKSIL